MQNYKVKVNSEAESKEVQELFFELGASLGNGDKHAVLVPNIMGLAIVDGLINFVFNDVVFRDTKQCKELTIPKLRDLVVLKRNDVADSTHYTESCGAKGFLSSEGIEYFWDHGAKEWNKHKHSNFTEYQMKPITKEPVMKEFLDPSNGYKLELAVKPFFDWIEIPEGAMFATGDDVIFRKNNYIFDDGKWKITNVTVGNAKELGVSIVWQRTETLNDKVATAEVARQEFIGVPFSDLPESDFITEGFEQDDVNQPKHYCSHPSGIECIEITRHHDFAIGNAIKYLWRAGLKDSANEIQDLEKSVWYIQDKINQLKGMKNEDK